MRRRGAAVFVAGFYWFLCLRSQPRLETPAGYDVTPSSNGQSEAGQHAAGPR